MSDPKAELDRKLQRVQESLLELKQQPEWQTNRPYQAMLEATVAYADTGLRDAIWIWAQMFVDVAATGVWNWAQGTKHTQIPAEFEQLFDGLYNQISQAQSVEEVYDALSTTMWDASTIGILMRPGVSYSYTKATFHIRTNETLLRQGAEAIWEILEASRRVAPIALTLEAAVLAQGLDGPAPQAAQQLVFYTTDSSGRERPPVWVQIHTALVGAHVSEQIALQNSETWVKQWDEAAGGPALRKLGDIIGEGLEAAGGVAGLAIIGLGVAAAVMILPRVFGRG